ncbi:hypothetical protein ACTFIY_007288 [Dictyostelium cf. discoideum]
MHQNNFHSSTQANSKDLSSNQQVKEQIVNIDYIHTNFHKPHFEWCYKAINYDLTRSFSYRNVIALIFHQIWIWICNQIFGDGNKQDETLEYEIILKKWHKSATLEYIKQIKIFKSSLTKGTLSICNKNNYNKIKDIKDKIVKDYCISSTVLPNIVIVDHFI